MTDTLSADTPLLVLDNCEHLIAAVAHVVDALLRGCLCLRILVTSREALRVPSLSLPGTDAPLAESEAVQLFVDRVRLRQPAFALMDGNAATVAAICRRLDGMPLALELAAARASILPLAQLEARLDDALRLLTAHSPSPSPPPTPRTTRGAAPTPSSCRGQIRCRRRSQGLPRAVSPHPCHGPSQPCRLVAPRTRSRLDGRSAATDGGVG